MIARLLRSTFLVLLGPAIAGAQGPASLCPADAAGSINRLIEAGPAGDIGRVGFEVADAGTGEIICARDPESFLTPASNTKLYTTAFALETLGPDYRFSTRIQTPGSWTPGTSTIGDLQIIGGGDPNLSGRIVPYQPWIPDRNPITALQDIANQIAATGIRSVRGDVFALSLHYGGAPYPDGWTLDDSLYGYGAPVTELAISDNTASLTIRGGDLGDLADVGIEPALSSFVILNQVTTVSGKGHEVHVFRPTGSNELIVWGTIGEKAGFYQEDIAMPDPALFAAHTLKRLLEERGISVRGEAKSQYCPPNLEGLESEGCAVPSGTTLLVHESAQLSQLIQVVNKVSQNLHAEMLLRNTALTLPLGGTLEGAVTKRQEFLHGPQTSGHVGRVPLDDGSGLARQDLTSPQATVMLLQRMWNSPHRDIWLQSLPIGGVDGSLVRRFLDVPGGERVHAKTGSLSHVNSLSGYLQTQSGRWLLFSIMVNGSPGNSAAVRDFIDSFCGIFLAQ